MVTQSVNFSISNDDDLKVAWNIILFHCNIQDSLFVFFRAVPTRFYERTSSGARIVSSCHSPGGSLVVFGDTHHNLRIYKITRDSIIKVSDIEAHTVR